MLGYLIVGVFLFAFCLIANRLSRTLLTAPLVFIAFGLLVSETGFLPPGGTEASLHLVAEIALIVLLFIDAAKIDQQALLKRNVWPARMLAIGLPVGFVLGTLVGLLLFPGWELAAVALVAALLVPTDAALGQPVVSNPDVPERPRRALTVESGLNDGLTLPLVLLLAAFVAPDVSTPDGGWIWFAVKQITLGPLVGLGVGLLGGVLVLKAKKAGYTAEVYEGIGALALAAAAYLAALQVGGNGFISAFAAGLGFGGVVRGRCAFIYEFTESEGQLLSWSAFFLVGAVLVPQAVAHLTLPSLAFILISLIFVRPIAIYLSLLGTDASGATRLYFGWFGPRGLATVLFALLVLEQLDHELGENVLFIATNAVWISALLHGITAMPGAAIYARILDKRGTCPEKIPMTENVMPPETETTETTGTPS